MKRLMISLRRRFNRDQSGQAILFLAIGFIALVAFIGLVTDISILFVRYSQLRRTVDAAAIAAAGQIREGSDYADVNLAARQFIQLHGLDPSRVLVETCETDVASWRAGTGAWEGDPHPEPTTDVNGDTFIDGRDADGITTFDITTHMGNTELCDWRAPRKLVRVTAQIESETTFLSLLGFTDITLEATSVSETAVLDVVLVMDTSASMALSTQYGDYPLTPGTTLRGGCDVSLLPPGSFDHDKMVKWAGCCNNPGRDAFVFFDDTEGKWKIYTENGGNPDAYDPGIDIIGIEDTAFDGDSGRPESPTDRSNIGNRTDLVCQPFRQAKDAARNFMQSLDYVRGDRIALVNFDRSGVPIVPTDFDPLIDIDDEGDPSPRYLMSDEGVAVDTLDQKLGVNENPVGNAAECVEDKKAVLDYNDDNLANNSIRSDLTSALPQTDVPGGYNSEKFKYWSYESVAPCPDTNVGGGLNAANRVLTNPIQIRRDAVWVIILLGDGAATATDVLLTGADNPFEYGYSGMCPWRTWCNRNPGDPRGRPIYPDCPADTTGPFQPYCNDKDPNTRHECLKWSTDIGDRFETDPALYDECVDYYDADDYARDLADFAGLIEVRPNIPGNFIAMFTIGFGEEIVDPARPPVGVELLRYIADAGDNGRIDDDIQQDLRDDDGILTHFGNYRDPALADIYGEPGPCEPFAANPREWCGQYYYSCEAGDPDPTCAGKDLDAVFDAIASRLFTRLSR